MQKIKYWWSDDRKWFCVLVNDGVNQATISLTPEEASLLSMNASPDYEPPAQQSDTMKLARFVMFGD